MTDDLIDRAKAAMEGVTPGPWVADDDANARFIAALIAALEARDARVKVLEGALTRIADASDYYANEREAENRGAEALAYAHSSTCRLARAAIEGEK